MTVARENCILMDGLGCWKAGESGDVEWKRMMIVKFDGESASFYTSRSPFFRALSASSITFSVPISTAQCLLHDEVAK